MTRPLVLLVSVLVLALGAGCGGDDGDSGSGSSSTASSAGGGGGGTQIAMKDIQFSPKEQTVNVDDTVTWTNDDAATHNVTADSGASFKSKDFGKGGSFSFKPTKAGTIQYECTLHPGMTGTLTVEG